MPLSALLPQLVPVLSWIKIIASSFRSLCTRRISHAQLTLFHFRYVRPIYIVCANSDGRFEAPPGEESSVESARQRLAFNARILQTFTAEHMNLHGFGRKTFRLEEDDNGNVKVHVFQSKLELDEALCMSGDKLYDYFHNGKLNFVASHVLVMAQLSMPFQSLTMQIMQL